MHVQAGFRGRDREDETADEEHHHRVGEAGHHLLVAEELAGRLGVADPFDSGIGGAQEQEDHDGDRGRPGGDQLQHPHQRGVHEDGDDPLLDRGEAVDAEGFRRQEPEDEDDDGHEDEAETFLLEEGRVEPILLTQLVHLFNQVETGKLLEHGFTIALEGYS